MFRQTLKRILQGARIRKKKNWALFDLWSLTHVSWGAVLAWLIDPWLALLLLVLYEPLEVFFVSPFMYKNFGVVFGNEGISNSLSDIVFGVVGLGIGFYFLRDIAPHGVNFFL